MPRGIRFHDEAGVNLRIQAGLFVLLLSAGFANSSIGQEVGHRVALAPPSLKGAMSVEEALHQRRSVRNFVAGPLGLADVGQLLWAAQGVTHPQGLRTAPSAGALQPLIVYLVAGHVTGLPAGVYQYDPNAHALILTRPGDLRGALSASALGQRSVRDAPAVLVIAADPRRTAQKYGPRAQRYVHIEVGHAAQNVYLQATARRLGTVLVGSFDDPKARDVLGLPADHSPLALMPFGRGR